MPPTVHRLSKQHRNAIRNAMKLAKAASDRARPHVEAAQIARGRMDLAMHEGIVAAGLPMGANLEACLRCGLLRPRVNKDAPSTPCPDCKSVESSKERAKAKA